MNNKYPNSINHNSQKTSISNNTFEFKRSVKISCCIVQADISIDIELKYILPILIYIKDQNGKATSNSIFQELDLGLIFKKKLIQKLLDEPLCEKLIDIKNHCYSLTEDGHHVINNKTFFVKKTRNIMLQITFSLDPLIKDDDKLLEIMDGSTKAVGFEDSDATIDGIDSNLDEFLTDRSCVTSKTDDNKANPIFKQETPFTIHKCFEYAKTLKPDIAVDIICSIDSNAYQIFFTQKSITDKKSIPRKEGQMPKIPHEKIWDKISFNSKEGDISKYNSEWDRKLNRILVSYIDTTPVQRKSMQATFYFKLNIDDSDFVNNDIYFSSDNSNTNSNFGEFEELEKIVDIYPKDSKEAQKWASDMRKYLLTNYLTRTDYDNLIKEIKRKFSNYTIHFDDDIDYDKTDSYGYDERHKSYWFIHAMEDWNL